MVGREVKKGVCVKGWGVDGWGSDEGRQTDRATERHSDRQTDIMHASLYVIGVGERVHGITRTTLPSRKKALIELRGRVDCV